MFSANINLLVISYESSKCKQADISHFVIQIVKLPHFVELVKQRSFMAIGLGHARVRVLFVARVNEAVVRQQRLRPDAANVVLAAGDEHVGDHASWHEFTNAAPRDVDHCSRMAQVQIIVLRLMLVTRAQEIRCRSHFVPDFHEPIILFSRKQNKIFKFLI